MPFSFSFSFSVPGLPNPFIARTPASAAPTHGQSVQAIDRHGSRPRRRDLPPRPNRSPSPCIVQPLSRKRGWIPAVPEPSQAATIQTSSGYLDTPAKYRDMAQSGEDSEIEEMVGELPPPKRRRTLAGSIVSTALSAALIGTAVGLTVYRLWRDRGKQQPEALPPPYESGEWSHKSKQPQPSTSTPVTQITPPTPRRKQRYVAGRRTVPRHRKTPSRAQNAYPSQSAYHPQSTHSSQSSYSAPALSSSPPKRAPIPPEFQFPMPEEPEEEPVVEDHMDWMGDRLAQLIEEGKRALGKEVVVMSDAQEDEVDDGSGAWVEDGDDMNDYDLHTSNSTSLRRARSRLRNINLPNPAYSPPSYGSPPGTPRKFDLSYSKISTPVLTPGRSRGYSVDSDSRSVAGSTHHEDESAWQTPELRESMEKARIMYRQRLLQQQS